MKKIKTLLVIGILFFYSCEESTEYEFNPIDGNTIVVNGLLTNEKKAHEITITKTVKLPNEVPEAATGALVAIYSSNDSLHSLTESPTQPGLYLTNTNFRAVINNIYTLIINYEQKTYSAATFMLPVSPFNRLKYRFDDSKQMYTIDSVCQGYDPDLSAMYEIQVDWSNVAGYDTIPQEDKKAILYYYTLKTIDVSEVFPPEKEKIYFPVGTTLIESKYSVTPRHESFIRSLLLETDWRGGLFSEAQSNVETNLNNGALGFFGVSTVIRDTIIVE